MLSGQTRRESLLVAGPSLRPDGEGDTSEVRADLADLGLKVRANLADLGPKLDPHLVHLRTEVRDLRREVLPERLGQAGQEQSDRSDHEGVDHGLQRFHVLSFPPCGRSRWSVSAGADTRTAQAGRCFPGSHPWTPIVRTAKA